MLRLCTRPVIRFDRTGAAFKSTVPCAFLKSQKDPEIKPDSEYPSFLWELVEKQPTLKELMLKYEEKGEAGLTDKEAIRLSRVARKQRVRDNKFIRSKF